MTNKPTPHDRLLDKLMERVRELDPDLATELSNARCDEITEAEDRAVLTHGRQILAVIEGRGCSPATLARPVTTTTAAGPACLMERRYDDGQDSQEAQPGP
jgi:hypothetical protein